MSRNLLLTKVTSKFGTALFGVGKVIADRYGGIVSKERKNDIRRA